jgi:hypothetical protein
MAKQLSKIRNRNAWYEVPTRTLYVKWCCLTRQVKSKKTGRTKTIKQAKKVPVPTPAPDVLYNNSIYTYLVNWIYLQDYEVYLVHDTRFVRVGKNRFDDFRLMIDELLNDYFNLAKRTSCKLSPMAMFSLYDFRNASKHKRKIAIISLDESDFTCVQMKTRGYFDYYFGGYAR